MEESDESDPGISHKDRKNYRLVTIECDDNDLSTPSRVMQEIGCFNTQNSSDERLLSPKSVSFNRQ